MTTITRRILLDKYYVDLIHELRPHVVDIQKVIDLEINEQWFETLSFLNVLNITDGEYLITTYNLEKEILPGKKADVLKILKTFIEGIRSL